MIGLDAAEPRLIERWTDDGSLPALARLRREGAYGRLSSSADWLVGSPWPTFYTGTPPGEHGFYHYLGWRPGRMAQIRPTPDHLPLRPFWRDLAARGRRVVAVDVPLAYAPEPLDGVEVSGWATHEVLMDAASHPPELLAAIESRFGGSPRSDEEYGLLPVGRLLDVRDEQNRNTAKVAELASSLMERGAWDFAIVAFSATHRGGHKLWNDAGVDGDVPAHLRAEFDDALRQVYVAADAAVARLVAEAGPGTTVMVFSVHGMGENVCRTEILTELLARVLAGGPPPAAKKGGIAKRLRELVPNRWRHEVKRRLPLALQDRLTSFWRLGRADWSRTRAFPVVADLQGYVRINLRGREAEGIVAPGAEYDALCDEIAEGLASFVDADTGASIVRDVARADRLWPGGARRHDLPDLLIRWAETPMAAHRRIVSSRYGAIDFARPGRNASGRSGNHRPHGFVLAAGPGVEPAALEGAGIMDLAPTVYRLLGLEPPAGMHGTPLPFRAGGVRRPAAAGA